MLTDFDGTALESLKFRNVKHFAWTVCKANPCHCEHMNENSIYCERKKIEKLTQEEFVQPLYILQLAYYIQGW